jgi:hypothetical protein
MTAAPATTKMLAPIAGLVDEVDVMAGLEHLARSPPLWPVDADRWSEVVGALMAFERRFGGQVRGWSPLALWGMHRRAPYANLAAMGAVFAAARANHTILEFGRDSLLMVSRAGSRLRIFRRVPDRDAVLAWTLCRPG